MMTNREVSLYSYNFPMIIIISKDFDFESAQSLPQFPAGHKCRNVHGHSFKITVSVRGPVDEASGLFYDHAAISDAMRPIVQQLDHAYLNDISGTRHPARAAFIAGSRNSTECTARLELERQNRACHPPSS